MTPLTPLSPLTPQLFDAVDAVAWQGRHLVTLGGLLDAVDAVYAAAVPRGRGSIWWLSGGLLDAVDAVDAPAVLRGRRGALCRAAGRHWAPLTLLMPLTPLMSPGRRGTWWLSAHWVPCFSAFPASLLVWFFCFLFSLLLCFSASLFSLLLCFCTSVPFYLYYSTVSFLQSCAFAALLPAPLLLCFLSILSLCFFHFLLLYSFLFLNKALERP